MCDVEPSQSETYRRIEEIVREALAPYGEGAASVEVLPWDAEAPGIEVHPVREGCARVAVGFDTEDVLEVTIGHTWFGTWLTDEGDMTELREVLDAVFAGRFEEAGGMESSFGQAFTCSGVVSAGHLHWPVPWRWRRKVRRFLPYGGE